MKTPKEIKPSQTFEFDDLPPGSKCTGPGIMTPYDYRWHKDGEKYRAHRKPTVNEILNDKFV